jgi:hypothetical protein
MGADGYAGTLKALHSYEESRIVAIYYSSTADMKDFAPLFRAPCYFARNPCMAFVRRDTNSNFTSKKEKKEHPLQCEKWLQLACPGLL